MILTDFLEHFVALIEDEDGQVWEIEVLLVDQSKNSTRCSYNNVWGIHTFEKVNMFLDWLSTVYNLCLNSWKMSGESVELILDLVCKLSSVAKNQCWNWFRVFWQLVKNCQNEDGSLSHTGLCLAKDVNTNHSLGDAFLLDLRWMLKSSLCNSSL